jgi:formate hydrogenlyase subunit 3/multisubunit Na+/H+ antiporter MnhD subunit
MGFNSGFKGLMVSNFAVCGMPFLAGFYSKDFILQLFSMRHVNMVGGFYYLCVLCAFVRVL